MSQFWKIKQRSSHLGEREEEIHRLTQDWWWCWWVNALLAHACGSQHHWPILQLRAATANDWSDVKIHMEWKNIVKCSQSFITWLRCHGYCNERHSFITMKICSRISLWLVIDLTWYLIVKWVCSLTSWLQPEATNYVNIPCMCFLLLLFLTVADEVQNVAHLKWLRAVSSLCMSLSDPWLCFDFWYRTHGIWSVTILRSRYWNKQHFSPSTYIFFFISFTYKAFTF